MNIVSAKTGIEVTGKPTSDKVATETESYLKLKGHDIICISVMDWDWPFPTSRHNLMREFALFNRVLFVDPPLHYLSDYRATLHKQWHKAKLARSLAGKLLERADNLYSFTPPPVAPFNRLPQSLLYPVLKSNGWLYRQAVRKAAHRLGMRRPLLWISLNPYFGMAVRNGLNEQMVLYHCTDEISRFPGYSPQIIEMERELLKSSDLVVTTSPVLQQNKKKDNPNTFFVPNGANTRLFQQALNQNNPLPADLAAIPEPRVGFTGQVEFRFDVTLLIEVARRRPDISFVLIGQEGPPSWEVSLLHAEPNIYLLGNKPQSALPAYLAGMQATIIPYKCNELTRSIYPLKLHEYLAAGRSVVATPLPSLEQFKEVVHLAATAEEFTAALDLAMHEQGEARLIQQRVEVAEQHSWPRVAGRISELLAMTLAAKNVDNSIK